MPGSESKRSVEKISEDIIAYRGAHPETIDDMINFVEMRKNEEETLKSMSQYQKLTSAFSSNKWLLMLSATGFLVTGGSGALLLGILGFLKDQINFYHYEKLLDNNSPKFKR